MSKKQIFSLAISAVQLVMTIMFSAVCFMAALGLCAGPGFGFEMTPTSKLTQEEMYQIDWMLDDVAQQNPGSLNTWFIDEDGFIVCFYDDDADGIPDGGAVFSIMAFEGTKESLSLLPITSFSDPDLITQQIEETCQGVWREGQLPASNARRKGI